MRVAAGFRVRVDDDIFYPEVQCARRDGLRSTRLALVCCTEHDLVRVRVRVGVTYWLPANPNPSPNPTSTLDESARPSKPPQT